MCDHTRRPKLTFALAMILTMNGRRFKRAHPVSGMGSLLSTSKDVGLEVIDREDQIQCWTQCVLQWLAQLALVLNSTQVLVTRSDLPMYALLATHGSLSLKNDDVIIMNTHHLCRTTHTCGSWLLTSCLIATFFISCVASMARSSRTNSWLRWVNRLVTRLRSRHPELHWTHRTHCQTSWTPSKSSPEMYQRPLEPYVKVMSFSRIFSFHSRLASSSQP